MLVFPKILSQQLTNLVWQKMEKGLRPIWVSMKVFLIQELICLGGRGN